MFLDYGLLVVCATITNFYVVSLAVPVMFRKVFYDELQKLSADVCLYVHTVGWIKPNYVSLSVLAAILIRRLQFHLFRHRRVLSVHQPGAPNQSTRLRL